MPDRSTQTEEPTQRRLEKARREGQFAASREFLAALQFLVFLALLETWGRPWLAGFQATMRQLLRLAFHAELDRQNLVHLAWELFRRHLLPLMAAGAGIAAATVAIRLIGTRFGFSLKKLAPDPQRLNPARRLRDLPRQNLAALVEAALLLPLFLWAVYAAARDRLETFLTLPLGSVAGGSQFLAESLLRLFWQAGALFLVFGCVDLFRQLRRHRQELRMSKQEIKEEMKEVEGNPEMKARIRRMQRDRIRRQMMKEVPKATAVVVNPTHYAVAIRYRMEAMAAPVVTAKGKNYLALRIRQKAVENQVPIVENPPLAQALYHSVEVGQEIPPHLYRAVAEILAYIYKLMRGTLPG